MCVLKYNESDAMFTNIYFLCRSLPHVAEVQSHPVGSSGSHHINDVRYFSSLYIYIHCTIPPPSHTHTHKRVRTETFTFCCDVMEDKLDQWIQVWVNCISDVK